MPLSVAPQLTPTATTRLTMTPQMQQAVRLLQMSHDDLADYIDQEIETNPLLERASPAHETSSDGVSSDALTSYPETLTHSVVPEAAQQAPLPPESSYLSVGSGTSHVMAGSGGRASRGDGHGGDESDQPDLLARLEAPPPDLPTHLIRQIRMDIADPALCAAGIVLVDCLDDSGWLPAELDLTALTGLSAARCAELLGALQRLDPPGIFARSLAECLALQLRERNRLDPAMHRLLARLDLVARREWEALRRHCNVDVDDLNAMLAELRTLNPRPAEGFTAAVATPVVPDLFIRPCPPLGWNVELNTDVLPRVLANERYHAHVRSALRRDDTQAQIWVREHWGRATWLVRALHQRATTLLRVGVELVRQQDAFLRHGVQHLRPLTLADVAAATELHESTISRVIRHKYIATPWGTRELRTFFTHALATVAGGEDCVAVDAIQDRVMRLIEAECWPKILSDQQLVALLRDEGIVVARRTVAKYRDALKIPASSARRWQKRPVGV